MVESAGVCACVEWAPDANAASAATAAAAMIRLGTTVSSGCGARHAPPCRVTTVRAAGPVLGQCAEAPAADGLGEAARTAFTCSGVITAPRFPH